MCESKSHLSLLINIHNFAAAAALFFLLDYIYLVVSISYLAFFFFSFNNSYECVKIIVSSWLNMQKREREEWS